MNKYSAALSSLYRFLRQHSPRNPSSTVLASNRTVRWSYRPSTARYLKLWITALCFSYTLLAPSVQAVETASFEIVAREGGLFPARLEVPAGVKLKLTLRNEGKKPVEFENLELRIEKILPPDAAATVTVQPLKPGSYTIVDEFQADTARMLLIAK